MAVISNLDNLNQTIASQQLLIKTLSAQVSRLSEENRDLHDKLCDITKVIDLIRSGEATGMSKFWENFKQLQGMSDDKVLQQMPRFAIEEAIELMVEEKE